MKLLVCTMEGDLTELLQKFSLEGNELLGPTLELEDFHTGVRACENSFIGRVIGEKVINFTGIKNFVAVAWGYPRNLSVVELGPNVFQFNVQNPDDQHRIVEGGPWVIDNQMLVLKRWVEGIEEDYKAFMTAPLWVQLWNLPVHWLSKEVGKKIGGVFIDVKEVLVPQSGGKEGRHLKVLALVDLSKPLLRGTMVRIAGAGKWIAFKYERCPDFCYNCGIVGHSERSCKEKRSLGGNNAENQYGPWLRAGNTRISPQEKFGRSTEGSDKRYWTFRNGEMVEQEKNRPQNLKNLVDGLEFSGKRSSSNQEREIVGSDLRTELDVEISTREEEDKAGSHDKVERQMNIEKEGLVLTTSFQMGEGIQTCIAAVEMEEDVEVAVHNQNLETELREKEVGVLVLHQDSLGDEKMGGVIERQYRRSFRKLKPPVKTRKPLQVFNGNDFSQARTGKRKMLIKDELMEEVQQDATQRKKSKPMVELYSEETRGKGEGSFLNGTSSCK